MLLRTLCMLMTLLFTNGALANRDLVLRSSSAVYELEGGYTLSLVASPDGEKLMSVKLTYQDDVMTIPVKELSQIVKPVLSAVLVSGGAVGSKHIAAPHSINIGFGANHCELSNCPFSVILVIKDFKFAESYVIKNGK